MSDRLIESAFDAFWPLKGHVQRTIVYDPNTGDRELRMVHVTTDGRWFGAAWPIPRVLTVDVLASGFDNLLASVTAAEAEAA